MLSEKNIVITIGNYGTVVALHSGNEIKNKIFLEDLDDKSQEDLKDIFAKNKSLPIYLLLDTIDQSYKKKIYPPVHKSDLITIIKRDMASDSDHQDSIKNYIILNKKLLNEKKQVVHRWECLFISSANSPVINKWIEFLLEMPNRLVGIYMLPVETFNLFKLFKKQSKLIQGIDDDKSYDKSNNLYCFVIQNKVSGIRQVVFSDHGIVFTRIVNYNFEQSDFLEKYEQDIYSTFEYLKRLFPSLLIGNLKIINVFPEKILNLIKKIQNIELSITNYTPFRLASEVGYSKVLSEKSNFCDLLISKIFSSKKKILKFHTAKTSSLEKFFIALKSSYYLNLGVLLLICFFAVFTIFAQNKLGENVQIAETEKFLALQDLNKVKISALDGEVGEEDDDVSEIIDFGTMEENLGSVGIDIIDLYSKLKFLKDFHAELSEISYTVNDMNPESPKKKHKYQISLSGELMNQSGNIEDLFKKFDSLVVEVQKHLKEYNVEYTELPKDIDFNSLYYSYPIKFNLRIK